MPVDPLVKRALVALTAITALAVAVSLTGGTNTGPATHASPTAPHPRTAKPDLGTITAAYPAGVYLEPGVEVLERIPASDLSTTALTKTDPAGPCASIPHDVVLPATVYATPDSGDAHSCRWTGRHALTITTRPTMSMARHVARSIEAAAGRSGADHLAHLAWLRIDGHYATEHVAADPAGTCHLTVDLGGPRVVYVRLHRLGFLFHNPLDTDPAAAVAKHCPVARAVARNLVRHVDATR